MSAVISRVRESGRQCDPVFGEASESNSDGDASCLERGGGSNSYGEWREL